MSISITTNGLITFGVVFVAVGIYVLQCVALRRASLEERGQREDRPATATPPPAGTINIDNLNFTIYHLNPTRDEPEARRFPEDGGKVEEPEQRVGQRQGVGR